MTDVIDRTELLQRPASETLPAMRALGHAARAHHGPGVGTGPGRHPAELRPALSDRPAASLYRGEGLAVRLQPAVVLHLRPAGGVHPEQVRRPQRRHLFQLLRPRRGPQVRGVGGHARLLQPRRVLDHDGRHRQPVAGRRHQRLDRRQACLGPTGDDRELGRHGFRLLRAEPDRSRRGLVRHHGLRLVGARTVAARCDQAVARRRRQADGAVGGKPRRSRFRRWSTTRARRNTTNNATSSAARPQTPINTNCGDSAS